MASDEESTQQDAPSKRCATCTFHKWRRQTGQNRTNGQNNKSKRETSRQIDFGRHLQRLVQQRTQELVSLSSNDYQSIGQSSSYNANHLPLRTIQLVNSLNNLYVT